MNTEEQAFIKSIIASDPTDKLVRLVYADWLDENNQPDKAHFIRLMCADKISDKMYREIDNLLLSYHSDWFGNAIPHVPLSICTNMDLWETAGWLFPNVLGIELGFLTHWRGTIREWVGHNFIGGVGTTIVQNYPIRRVEFTDLFSGETLEGDDTISGRLNYPDVIPIMSYTYDAPNVSPAVYNKKKLLKRVSDGAIEWAHRHIEYMAEQESKRITNLMENFDRAMRHRIVSQ